MSFRQLLRIVLAILLPISIASTVYLYLYPVFHGCSFPSRDSSALTSFANTLRQHTSGNADRGALAPFRLLALADPQLEGDSSLPNPKDALVPSLKRHWKKILAQTSNTERIPIARDVVNKIVLEDIPKAFQASRKRLDLLGNDYYLGHIYRTLHWWTKPTHVAVLGDLIGSQWVTDEEFEWRGWRYWNRVFKHGVMVGEEVTGRGPADSKEENLGVDPRWSHRIINIVGNHDGGYGGGKGFEASDLFL
jgi:hypothetical protein